MKKERGRLRERKRKGMETRKRKYLPWLDDSGGDDGGGGVGGGSFIRLDLVFLCPSNNNFLFVFSSILICSIMLRGKGFAQ